MAKQSVNLILAKKKEPKYLHRMKIIFPLLAGATLVIFLISFLLVIGYINTNSLRFNSIQSQVSDLEKSISSQKDTEGIYSVTASRLTTLDQILKNGNTFKKLISEINDINSSVIVVDTVTADKLGNLNISFTASSSSALDEFITQLLSKEDSKIFSDIFASGVVREKKGNYHVNLTLKGNKTLIE